jgi:O-antigen biosynthesis protein
MTVSQAKPCKPVAESIRPKVCGKFLYVGDNKIYLRGITYGTFRPDAEGHQYPDPETVDRDFSQMSASGINTVRTYTIPPRWLLDKASEHKLWVLAGFPWEGHITFLDDHKRVRDIENRLRSSVLSCLGHPAILCYSIGNEIPSPIVRWHGKYRIEQFLRRLCRIVKSLDPEALVTYVNYPTTEYLQLPFLDFPCFNVFLESPDKFSAYIARLQNLAGERPLVMTEIGLDSRRNGEEVQAHSIDWQVRTAFASGCAGVFVFSWTDSWYRGGYDIEDWDFGLTRRDRTPKPALAAVERAFTAVPFPEHIKWPRISVVVCSYNGSRTIRDCFEGLTRLDYPDYEVIVVDDGSKDNTASIAREYDFRLISTENRGLSNARNTGLEAATGEIVAYIDDDAYPDPQWLKYLAATFLSSSWAAVGGPNLAPANDGWIADCVANAPGGPVPVLLSDLEAEHIAGCNMAFRQDRLKAISGFDPRFHTAGDDVDVCWRIQQRGWKLGYSPSALVWHHRRNSLRIYHRQQIGYGKAEALLERRWPEKYNPAGHISWVGRLYGKGLTQILGWSRGRIYHGSGGAALFQSLYQPAPGLFWSLPLMPEWYLIILFLALMSALGVLWTPLLVALPLFALAIIAPLLQAALSAARASFPERRRPFYLRLRQFLMTGLMHLIQPAARLKGRLIFGLTPWRNRGKSGFSFPWPRVQNIWSEKWDSAEGRLRTIKNLLHDRGVAVLSGGDFDRWDFEIKGGLLASLRVLMTIEEHGGGKQQIRFRSWPEFSAWGIIITVFFAGLCGTAAFYQSWIAAGILGIIALLLAGRIFFEGSSAAAALTRTLSLYQKDIRNG